MVPCTAHVAEQTSSIEKSKKKKKYFQTFHINFSPNVAGKEFWLKVYPLPGFSSPFITLPFMWSLNQRVTVHQGCCQFWWPGPGACWNASSHSQCMCPSWACQLPAARPQPRTSERAPWLGHQASESHLPYRVRKKGNIKWDKNNPYSEAGIAQMVKLEQKMKSVLSGNISNPRILPPEPSPLCGITLWGISHEWIIKQCR